MKLMWNGYISPRSAGMAKLPLRATTLKRWLTVARRRKRLLVSIWSTVTSDYAVTFTWVTYYYSDAKTDSHSYATSSDCNPSRLRVVQTERRFETCWMVGIGTWSAERGCNPLNYCLIPIRLFVRYWCKFWISAYQRCTNVFNRASVSN